METTKSFNGKDKMIKMHVGEVLLSCCCLFFFWWIYNYTDCELLDDTLRIFQKLIKIYINKRDLSCGLSGGFKHSIAPAGLNGSIRGFFGGHCECSRQMAVT